jgi:transcriptional regulator with XRE-family HTH domain
MAIFRLTTCYAAAMNRVAELRRERGLTQEELAYRTRVSLRTVAGWEKGRSTPHKRNGRNLAKALGVDLDALRFGIDHNPDG